MRVAGLVLAGGRSSRMEGLDKARALLAGRSLLERAVGRLLPQVDTLAVSANDRRPDLDLLHCPILADPMPDHPGPLAGILAGLEWASPGHDAVATVAVDTPFFPCDLVANLREQEDGTAAVARSGGRLHPVFALWPCTLAAPLRRFLLEGKSGRVTAFMEEAGYRAVDFPLPDTPSGPLDPFFNVNTPADLQRAEALALELER